jgi:hypothetical protein
LTVILPPAVLEFDPLKTKYPKVTAGMVCVPPSNVTVEELEKESPVAFKDPAKLAVALFVKLNVPEELETSPLKSSNPEPDVMTPPERVTVPVNVIPPLPPLIVPALVPRSLSE